LDPENIPASKEETIMDFSKLDLLESKVGSLLARITDAEDKARHMEKELDQAKAQVNELTEERQVILKKIDELLGRLESIPM
jgi:vacuolar-type H+-ATPase subunit I/STV1